MRRALFLGLILLFLVGCRGSDSSGPSGAPVISNLRVVPRTALVPGHVVMLGFFVDYVDAQGDVFGGLCRLNMRREPPSTVTLTIHSPIDHAAPGFNTVATSGQVVCVVQGTYSATPATVRLSIVDIRGNESNVLTVLTLLEHPTPA